MKIQVETDYKDELELLYEIIDKVQLISLNQGGIKTDGRGIRAMRIFMRQTLTAISLCKLLPNPDLRKDEFWDIGSVASLSRNLIEGYISLYYFGIENISESEAELRFYLLQLHKNMEWYKIRKGEMELMELKQFENGIANEKQRLFSHPFLSKLTKQELNRVKKVNEIYKSKMYFEENLPVCKGLRQHYRHLSNLVHPLPLSIERINNTNGRGGGSEADIRYCLICVMLSRKYLAATLIDITDKFKKELGDKFKAELEKIRPLVNKGF